MSQRLANPIPFLKYLNRLHIDEKKSIDPARDLVCWKCGKEFTENDIIIPQGAIGKGGRKKRHLHCAFSAGLLTKQQYEKLRQLKNVIYVVLLTGWAMAAAQHIILANG